MSEKIDNSNVHFSGAYKFKKTDKEEVKSASLAPQADITKSVGLGDGAVGKALVQMSKISFKGKAPSKDMIEDVKYFKKNPEVVTFYNEIADRAISNGEPYFKGLQKAQNCLDALKGKE